MKSTLPTWGVEEVENFTTGLRAFKLPLIGRFPVAWSIWDSWNRIRGSHCLINDYGSTETFNMMCSFPADKGSQAVCVRSDYFQDFSGLIHSQRTVWIPRGPELS